jgi:hypothetical protein
MQERPRSDPVGADVTHGLKRRFCQAIGPVLSTTTKSADHGRSKTAVQSVRDLVILEIAEEFHQLRIITPAPPCLVWAKFIQRLRESLGRKTQESLNGAET